VVSLSLVPGLARGARGLPTRRFAVMYEPVR
jgi:hypothetical protein